MTLLYRISGSFALMSFLGALFVIVTFGLYKDLKRHPTQMIFYLSVCDLVFSFNRDSIAKSGDGTCWLKNRSLIRLTFFIPLLTYIALSVGSLITTFIYSRGTYHSYDKGRMGMLIRMSCYTFIFIICWLGPLIHRVYQWIEQGTKNNNNEELDNSWFMYFDAIGVSIQGFFNAMIWLTNPQFFNALIKNLQKLLPSSDILSDETIPLFTTLADQSQDPIQLAKILRQNIITCCLKGIQLSVRDNNNADDIILDENKPSTQQTVYNETDLFNQELSSTPHSNVLKKHKFKDYSPAIFAKIRQLQGISNEQFLESFNCHKFFDKLSNQKFSEGKSGSFMCFTPDTQYLIKTITADESRLLRKLIIHFYKYFQTNNQSFLTKFYGSYKVVMPNGHFVYLAIMSNVFSSSSVKMTERYDIKGSSINRGGKYDYNRYNTLGLDLDFINVRKTLSLSAIDRETLIKQMANDSEFLKSLNIMDYSLLIGIKPKHQTSPSTTSSTINNLYQTVSPSLIPKHIRFELDQQQNQQNSPLSLSLPTILTKHESNANNPDDNQMNNNNNEYIDIDDNHNELINNSNSNSSNNNNGIIDVLQLYDFEKKSERFFKVYFMMKNRHEISSAPPEFYQERFMKRITQIATDGGHLGKNGSKYTIALLSIYEFGNRGVGIILYIFNNN
ncbi:G-protein-coupled receptor family protein [Heterostelium album PN500]|uniref:G-protein-coupled receptor family protein n=1 Tax=Heterostelium pallidum (strain ATCC 26659 / Pp 5 / PN500) TaxID=670386 RepID=D3AWU0_HETP5|nr:G-protein-coupled receptor family protein [Heterostelium album PN500]EFA86763.1 G-protein-coupled receptor family protein [Heterostelium album PN500]|eukprot:XP_020438867.1 G-protein-coupled receptor family protein [Heterostelium album PN500]